MCFACVEKEIPTTYFVHENEEIAAIGRGVEMKLLLAVDVLSGVKVQRVVGNGKLCYQICGGSGRQDWHCSVGEKETGTAMSASICCLPGRANDAWW